MSCPPARKYWVSQTRGIRPRLNLDSAVESYCDRLMHEPAREKFKMNAHGAGEYAIALILNLSFPSSAP